MARDWAKRFYDSTVWQKQRKYILARDHYTCTEPGCHNVATEVHHIVELTEQNVNDYNIALNENNLRSLCHDCHVRITKEMKQKDSELIEHIVFDANGNPIAVHPNGAKRRR